MVNQITGPGILEYVVVLHAPPITVEKYFALHAQRAARPPVCGFASTGLRSFG
jgi:hypothetical protein